MNIRAQELCESRGGCGRKATLKRNVLSSSRRWRHPFAAVVLHNTQQNLLILVIADVLPKLVQITVHRSPFTSSFQSLKCKLRFCARRPPCSAGRPGCSKSFLATGVSGNRPDLTPELVLQWTCLESAADVMWPRCRSDREGQSG